MAARFAGVILAGGRGERYGGPKALACLPDGRTFLAACADCFNAAGAEPIVATLPPDIAVPAVAHLVTITLPSAGLAMFDSLRLGLRRALADASWTAAVLLPVDHPLVGPETIRALAAVAAEAAIPSYRGKHGHPVMLSRSLAEGIASGVLAGPTLREVLRGAGTVDLPVDDPGVTANCNTPDALAAALNVRRRSGRAGAKTDAT
jgi:CTP:molybdopterin cytidylyltransferase MocA